VPVGSQRGSTELDAKLGIEREANQARCRVRVCAIEDAQARAKVAHLFTGEFPAPGGGIPFDSYFTTPVNFMKLLLHPNLDDPGIQRALRNGDRP